MTIFALSSIAWVTLNIGFAFLFHRLLNVPLTAYSAIPGALLGVWIVAALFFFRSRASRLIVFVAYSGVLIWMVVNFAYYEVYQTVVPFSFEKIGTLNGPMLRHLIDYGHLVPAALIGAVAVSALGALLFAGYSRRMLNRSQAATPDNLLSVDDARTAVASIVRGLSGIALQVFLVVAVVHGIDVYRSVAVERGYESERMLGDLGVIGYALAADSMNGDSSAGTSTAGMLSVSGSNEEELLISLKKLGIPGRSNPVSLPRYAVPPNLIVYQLESVSDWALRIDPSPMPFLESLMDRYATSGKYVANGCTTIDAEFAVNCSFFPESYGPVSDLYSKNDFRCLPSILKEAYGYRTAMYHANDPRFWSRDSLVPAWGFDEMRFDPEFSHRLPDVRVLDRAVDDIIASDAPSYSYVIGMTSHSPHDDRYRKVFRENYGLDISPYEGDLGDLVSVVDADEVTVRNYLGFLGAVDSGLKEFFQRLENEGLLDSTIVAIVSDHRYYGVSGSGKLDEYEKYNLLPFALVAPGVEGEELQPLMSHVDVAPTLLDLSSGGEVAQPNAFLGQSAFDEGFSSRAISKCLGKASYYDGESLVESDVRVGAYAAWDRDGDLSDEERSALIDPFGSVIAFGDLMLKRNDIGGDGIPEQKSAEDRMGGNRFTDTDGDGISDLREKSIGTDPRSYDTDGDGFSDGTEIANGFNPLGDGRWVR